VVNARKVAVSIRMPAADVRKVKKLAARLSTRESEVVRFAVKTMLARLAPLCEPEATGRSLVPAFVECGAEFLRFFDLDAARIEAIINEGATSSATVDREDIALLALTGAQQPYAELRLSQINAESGSVQNNLVLTQSLREYLYEKYVYRTSTGDTGSHPIASLSAAGGST
jgi:hypothetical protein